MADVDGGNIRVEGPPVDPQPGSNPMLNSVVLQTLFKHASIEEIKTYRQVCKIWCEESLPRWRRDVWVRLVDDIQDANGLPLERYLDGINGSASSDPSKFGKHPYENVKFTNLKRISLVEENGVTNRQLEFWSKCGPTMKQLEITGCNFRSIQDVDVILFRFVPNLISLYLTDIGISEDERDEDDDEDDDDDIDLKDAPPESTINRLEEVYLKSKMLPFTMARLFYKYQKIKSLSMTNPITIPFPYVMAPMTMVKGHLLTEILGALIYLARDEKISWNLEKLDLLTMANMDLENNHVGLFQHLQLPITTLCLNIGTYLSRLAFKRLLETYAGTLRKLVAYRDRDDFSSDSKDIQKDFPFGVQLDSLTDLCLIGGGLRPSLNFLPFTPNLRSLILAQDIGTSLRSAGSHVSTHEELERIFHSNRSADGDPPERSVMEATNLSRLENFVCTKLEEFVVSGRDEKVCSSDQVVALSRLMPNLKTLMLGLGNEGFRTACEGWKQLEVLIIQPYEVDQFGLTGNDPSVKQRLPNLSDLTKLRYFGMGCDTKGKSNTKLTDESVLNAIFPLENLRGITAVYDVDKMSDGVRDQLMSKFPRSKIRKNGKHEWRESGRNDADDTDE